MLDNIGPKDFLCGFISIEMTKIVVGSSSLIQPLLLYLGLAPAMLDNIGRVKGDKQIISEIQDYQKVVTHQLPRSLTSSERNNFCFTLVEFGLKTSSQTVK
jgi:hypothetical protein